MEKENVSEIFTLGTSCYRNKRSERLLALSKGKRLMGLSDIIEFSMLETSFISWDTKRLGKYPCLLAICISTDWVYILKGLMKHRDVITAWEKIWVVPSTLFSIKKASLGNANMWKQATKNAANWCLLPSHPYRKVLKCNKALGS